MAIFTHSVLAQNESVTADTVITYDLPVNPLSFILFTLRFSQNRANQSLEFANITAMLDRIEVLFKGSAVYSLNGADALAAALLLAGFESWGINEGGDDNDVRSFTFLVPLTRMLYSPVEAFPKSTRGELILQVSYASSFTNIDGVVAQIETVELPEAAPERFLRMTTLSRTPAATGELDVDLPIGNLISDIVLFGTTISSGATLTRTIEWVQLLVDNQRVFYSQSNFESLHNLSGRLRSPPGYHGLHKHTLLGATYAQYADTDQVDPVDHVLANHLLVPLDVDRLGTYALDTKGKSDVVLRMSAGDTNALRVIPAEIVSVAGGL